MELFKSGWDSVYRLTIGIFSALFPATLFPAFIATEVFLDYDEDAAIRIREVLVGYAIGLVMLFLFKLLRAIYVI